MNCAGTETMTRKSQFQQKTQHTIGSMSETLDDDHDLKVNDVDSGYPVSAVKKQRTQEMQKLGYQPIQMMNESQQSRVSLLLCLNPYIGIYEPKHE